MKEKLRLSIRTGNFKKFKKHIAKSKTKSLNDALILATEEGNLKMMKYLLKKGVDPNFVADTGPVIFHAYELEPMKILIEYGADINSVYEGDNLINKNLPTPEILEFVFRNGLSPFIDIDENTVKNLEEMEDTEGLKVLARYQWMEIKDSVDILSRQYSANGVPKDIWKIILLKQRRDLYCKHLSNDKYKYLLYQMAMYLGVDVSENTSKKNLCSYVAAKLSFL